MNSSDNRTKKIRFRYFNYPRFQLPLILISVSSFAGYFLLLWFQLERSYGHMKELGKAANFPPDHSYFKFISFQQSHVTSNLIIGAIISFVLSALVTVYISHKMAGPLYRLRIFFHDRSQGLGPNAIHFRKNDYLKDIESYINEALHRKE